MTARTLKPFLVGLNVGAWAPWIALVALSRIVRRNSERRRAAV